MLRIVPHTVPRVGRSYEHFPDGFQLHLLPGPDDLECASASGRPHPGASGGWGTRDGEGKRQGPDPQVVVHLTRYTLHPTPYTLHPTPYALHPTPYTLSPEP